MKQLVWKVAGAALVLGAGLPARAAVKPHALFSDHAVLQQGIKLPVWGTARDGEKVTVSIAGRKASTVARNGEWRVDLAPLKAGGPYTLSIDGDNKVELKDVLVGEVWIASGQSNMEWPLAATTNAEQAIENARDPQLRLFTVPKATSKVPLREVNAQWQECTPQTVRNFSAVAYFFGRDLRRSRNVPVGLIHTSWGGTVSEAWTSQQALEAGERDWNLLSMYRRIRAQYPAQLINYSAARRKWEEDAEKARQEGKPVPPAPQMPGDPDNPGNPNRPSVLYNAMIAPLVPYGIKGAIWYQGESNAGRAYQYQTLFPAMIRNWRQDWGQGDFPFLLVQLAPFMAINPEPMESAWAELREAQRLSTLNTPNVGMAVITDVGEQFDIHPKQKEPVGARLALEARRIAYGEKITSHGPTFDSLKVDGDKAILRFKDTGGGLVVKGDKLTGFTVAGEDHKWYNATATLAGPDRVVVSSPSVKKPVAVRYGWTNFPVVNLWNQTGLPASPFRTDDFPLTTQPK